jgi:phosphotriesterase-related protein
MSSAAESPIGMVQTVLGLLPPDELGVTLSHEHCLLDLSGVRSVPKEASKRKVALEPVSYENLYYVRYHPTESLDNLRLLDEDLAIRELARFKRSGGRTVVDHTNADLARDPVALVRISEATGLNVIMGSGYYVNAAQDLEVMERRTEDDIADEIVREVGEGVGDTGIRVGLIGEIGCSWPLEEAEKKVVRAAGLAQKDTGAPLSIHPGRHEDAPAELIRLLKEVGADLSHTHICHIERTVFEPRNRYEIAEAGCYLAYDLWGNEGYYPEALAIADILNDTQRIAQIKDLIQHEFGKQILLSHDICYKCRYTIFGGHGYGHILENAVPAMKKRGMTEEQINDLLVENPKRFFAFW